MPTQCFVPSASGVTLRVASAFGHIVEYFARTEYCLAKGGCDEFAIGGAGIDFFDEQSTTTRCRFLAAYLGAHNAIDSTFVSSTCEIRKRPVDPGDDENERFAVPDIMTHDPGNRMEFYEIKSNSASGKQAGRTKIAAVQAMVDFFKQTDPGMTYIAGTQFDPDRSIVIWDGTWLGSPIKATLHFFRETDGLIVYEICVEISSRLLAEVIIKDIIKLAVLAVILLMAPVVAGGAAAIAWTSPLGESVGPDQTNDGADVRYVQALLNDWRGSTGGELLALDGDFSDTTAAVLADFQSSNSLEDTGGRVDPGDATLLALETAHFTNATSAVNASELPGAVVEDFTDFGFKDDPDGSDPRSRRNPTSSSHWQVRQPITSEC